MPRFIGVLYALAGACYRLTCYSFFFAPELSLAPYVQLGSLVGEAAFALWLLTMGVDEQAWRRVSQPRLALA